MDLAQRSQDATRYVSDLRNHSTYFRNAKDIGKFGVIGYGFRRAIWTECKSFARCCLGETDNGKVLFPSPWTNTREGSLGIWDNANTEDMKTLGELRLKDCFRLTK